MISSTDLKFLHLAIAGGGCFDESDIAGMNIGKIGTGAVLDELASLRQRGLLRIDGKKFCITDEARSLFWSDEPLWRRILGILQVMPLEIKDICAYLNEAGDAVEGMIEDLRRDGMVVMIPVRKETGVCRTYEILPEGREMLASSENYPNAKDGAQAVLSSLENTVSGLEIDSDIQEKMLSEIKKLQKMTKDAGLS